MSIFDEPENSLQKDYPELLKYVKVFHDSFWEIEHFKGYSKDVLEFKASLSKHEQEVGLRSMLAVASVENFVKTFWSDLHHRLPRMEVAAVGLTIGANETVHQLCYQRLVELLGLEREFENISQVPCMIGRSKYLRKYKEGVRSRSNKEFTKSLILFTLLIENVALFSQFYILASFYKHTNRLVNFSDIVSSTMLDEQVHGNFGAALINIIRQENPEWFDFEMEDKIRRNVRKAYKCEIGVLDWIFESGDLNFVGKVDAQEFIKSRFNDSLSQIGYAPEFQTEDKLLEKSQFINEKLNSVTDFDFFYNTGNAYNKASFDQGDIW